MKPIGRISLMAAVLGVAAAALSLWLVHGTAGILGAGLALLATAIAVVDARHLIIPNELNAGALALALVHAAAIAPDAVIESIGDAALRGIATMLLFFGLRTAYRKLRGREGLGLGDVKLALVAGAWLDWRMLAAAIEIAAAAAIVAFIAGRAIGATRFDMTTRLPFGLFLAPAIWIAWLIGSVSIGR